MLLERCMSKCRSIHYTHKAAIDKQVPKLIHVCIKYQIYFIIYLPRCLLASFYVLNVLPCMTCFQSTRSSVRASTVGPFVRASTVGPVGRRPFEDVHVYRPSRLPYHHSSYGESYTEWRLFNINWRDSTIYSELLLKSV